MTKAQAKIGVGCVLLFVLFFPALNLFLHPISVLYSTDYKPLVLRLDDFYMKTGVLLISLLVTPFLFVAVIWLMQKQRLRFVSALLLLLTPFLLALIIQYFITVQVDKYLRVPHPGDPVPWKYVFQSGFMLHCLRLGIGYAALCAVLCFAMQIARRKPTSHLNEQDSRA